MRGVLSPSRRPRHRRGGWGRPLSTVTLVPSFRAGRAAAALATVVAAAYLLAPIAQSGATPGNQLVPLGGATPPSPSLYGATAQGPASSSARLSLQVYFRPANSARLNALATAVSTPGNPFYHHFLTVAQFAAQFGPGQGTVSALGTYLRSKGISVGQLSANRLGLDVRGTSRQFERAFGVPLVKLRTDKGAEVVGSLAAPELPARLAGSVSYVDGLQPWVVPFSNLVRLPQRQVLKAGALQAADKPATSATALNCGEMSAEGLTPAQLDSAYRLTGFKHRGDQGQGETVALIEYGLPDTAAVTAYEACTGATLSIDYVPALSPPTQTDTEVAADIEVLAALVPKANVIVYEASQQGTDLAPWDMAVSGDPAGKLPEVISDSWGSCEQDTGLTSAYYQAEEEIYEEAAIQGQTTLVASGDDGSEGCLDQTKSNQFAVYDPASAPFVTAVGGTASTTVDGPQYIWNSHNATDNECLNTGCSLYGASGGGFSTVWPRPGYQPASIPRPAACPFGLQGCREVPDVSAIAGDPYGQYCSPRICGGGSPWVGFGGTSVAAPSWAAVVLLSDQACSSDVGFLNPLLYSTPSRFLGRITAGNNDLTGRHGGQYEASPSGGYSMAGGLGYLGGADLSSGALCGPGAGAGSPATTTAPTTTTTTTPATTTPATTTPATTGPAGTSPATGTPLGRAVKCVKPVNQPVQGKPDALAATEDSNDCGGYLVVTANGAVSGFGAAITYGSLQGHRLNGTVVGIASMPGAVGYWLLTSNGEVFSFGEARFHGQPSTLHSSSPSAAIATTPDGKGYWVVTRAGTVYAFGDARSYGSVDVHHLNGPVVGIAATPDGHGYWLAASDGGVFAFGDAKYHGSLVPRRENSRVVGISANLKGNGYFLATANGDVFAFGPGFYGSRGADPPPAPVVAIAPSVDRKGYYLIDSAGHVYAFGDAIYGGNATKPIRRPPK